MTKKLVTIVLSILLVATILIGCSQNASAPLNDQKEKSDTSDKSGSDIADNQEDTKSTEGSEPEDETDESQSDEVKKENDKGSEDSQEVLDKKVGIPSPLSGLYGPENKVNRRPVAIMFDNHPRARWQAGLRQAEIVYEFQVEFPYTRYMGIFLKNDPIQVGPIRSSRPYFVTALLEYDPVYVRVGGSMAAYEYIERLNLADIDGIKSGGFWRYYDTGKSAPNNMYSSMKVIRNTQKARGYRLKGNYETFNFNEEDTTIEGKDANAVTINYNENNTTKYVYNEQEKAYIRYKDGKLHLDELDELPIIAKNIIIQKAKTERIDNVGRLEIDIIGTGTGYYVTNGKVMDVTWKKESEKSKTRYYDENGNEISLNSGQTWIQVVSMNPDIDFREGKK